MLGFQGNRQRIEIDHRAACIVDEIAARLHQRDLALADHAMRRRGLGHMQRDDIALGQQRIERLRRLHVAIVQLVDVIVIDDAHAERFGKHGKLAADVAVADDAERLAAHFAAADGGFIPAARVRRNRFRKYTAIEHDDFGNRQFGDAARIRERCIEYRYTTAAGRIEIDLIGADRKTPDCRRPLGRIQYVRGDLRARADAEHAYIFESMKQFVFVERLLHPHDVRKSGCRKGIRRRVRNTFEQQDLDLVFRQVRISNCGHLYPAD